jgi:hypothetical protein
MVALLIYVSLLTIAFIIAVVHQRKENKRADRMFALILEHYERVKEQGNDTEAKLNAFAAAVPLRRTSTNSQRSIR